MKNLRDIEDIDDIEADLERCVITLPAGISEHNLFNELSRAGHQLFDRATFDEQFDLFRAHFVLFHLLYKLQQRLWDTQRGNLEIGCMRIALHPHSEEATQDSPERLDPLRSYYTDLGNLERTTAADVHRMLDGFWQRFMSGDQRHEALATLGLPADAGPKEIKQAYHRLALEHHPDKGGDAAQLQRINAAMEALRR